MHTGCAPFGTSPHRRDLGEICCYVSTIDTANVAKKATRRPQPRAKSRAKVPRPGIDQGPSDLQSDALPTELSRRHNTIVPYLSKFFTHTRSPSRIPRTHPLTARLPLRHGYPDRPSKCRSTTISRQTSRRQPAAAYIAIAPFRPCTDAPSRTAVVCASVSCSRTVP